MGLIYSKQNHTEKHTIMNFRLDINGLRFIAVAMVVLFHFKLGSFYGGYAGVDVFFVISGFLMQQICSKEMGTKGWVINFYKKRFKRIYPALFVMVFFTFLLALYSETPLGLSEFVSQSFSALTFTSNLYYLNQSGSYFATSSDLNWLLHTWSLSLEWQYYLIFPLIIKIGTMLKGYRNWFYLLIIALSFSLSVLIGLSNFGDKIISANFYILPTRAWELMVGAYASVCTIKNNQPKVTEALAIISLLMFTLFVSDSGIWPGLLTLIPVLSAAAIIHANAGNSDTLLRNKTIQYIGSASYSIYLFHWPVVAFMANNSIEFTPLTSAFGIAISLILGAISYKYFEKMFRGSFSYLAITASAFVAISLASSKMEVSKLWISSDTIELDIYKNYALTKEGVNQFGNDSRTCFLTSESNDFSLFQKNTCLNKSDARKNILLIGDSHAAELYGSMRDVFSDYNIMQATASGCMPFKNPTGQKRCTDLVNYIYNDYLTNNKVDYVFISANWANYKKDDIAERLISISKDIGTDRVFVIGQTKVFGVNFYRIAQKVDEDNIESLVNPVSIKTNDHLSNALGLSGVRYLDIFNSNCINGKCSYIDTNKIPMLFDQNHLTKEWADRYVHEMRKQAGI